MADEFDDYEAEFKAKKTPVDEFAQAEAEFRAAQSSDAPQDIDTSDIPQSGPPGGGANASTQTILGSDDFPDATAEPTRKAAQQAPRARISAVDESLAPDNPYTPASAEDVVRAGARVITAPSRYGAKAGRAVGEEFTRDTVGKFGMDASPEAVKKGGELGDRFGNLAGMALEYVVGNAMLPGVGTGLRTLGQKAVGSMARGGAVFGAHEAAHATADGGGVEDVVKAGAHGVALGGALGAAGAVPGMTAFYLSPKFQDGIMKAIMPRLLGTAVESGIGVADAAARGGDKVDMAMQGALFGLFGAINSKNFSARDKAAMMDSAIAKPVEAMGGTPEAVATARQALQQELGRVGQADIALRSHPNFQRFLVELEVQVERAHPELPPEAISAIANREADKLFMNGEVTPETLSKMKLEVKPVEPEAGLVPRGDAPESVPLKTAPISDKEAWANAMTPEVQSAQERAGGDMEAISRALEMPPSQEAPAAAEGPRIDARAERERILAEREAQAGAVESHSEYEGMNAEDAERSYGPAWENNPAIAEAVKKTEAMAADNGDISFYSPADQAEEMLRAPATHEELTLGRRDAEAPVHELAPQDLAQRFPDASPEVQERLLRRVAQAGYPISPEAAKTFPALQADIEEGARAAALKAAQGEGESNRPGHDLLKRLGGVDSDTLKKNGEFSETKDIKGGVIKKGGAIRGWDHAAEILHQHGLIRERDAEMAKEFIIDESKKPLERGMGPGASSAKALKVKPRPLDMLPEEVIATAKSAGIKVGAKVPLIRGVKDPVFGKIAKGSEVTILALDIEGANAIIEYKDPANLLQATDIAVVPITAMAKPVRNAPREEMKPAAVKERVLSETGVKDTSPVITTTEREQLKLVMKAQEHAATKARLAVEKVARKEIRDLIRNHAAEGAWADADRNLVEKIDKAKAKAGLERQEEIRKKIVAYAKSVLPPAKRFAMLSKVAKAKTGGDLAQAMDAINKMANELQNKSRLRDIRKMVDRMLDSSTFPEEVKAQVRAIFKDINLENYSKRTIDKMIALQSFIDRVKASGADVEIPQNIVRQLSKLANRPLNELEPEEVEAVYTALKQLSILGKGIREAKQVMEEVEIDVALSAFEDAGRKTEWMGDDAVSRKQGETSLAFVTKMRNKLLRTLDFFQSVGLALRPNQTIVDEFGPEFRTFLMNPLDDGYTAMISEYAKGVDVVEALVQKYGIPSEQRQDAITTVLMREQGQDGINKLKQLGMTREEIDAEVLTPEERAIADALRGHLNNPDRVARLKAVDEEVYNQPFVEVHNRWPMKTDYGVKGEPIVHAQGADIADILKAAIDSRRNNVDVGQLQARKMDAKQIIRRDIFGVFLDDVRQGAVITNLAQTLIRTKKIIQDPRFSKAAGGVPYDFFNDMIDLLARDGKFPKTKFEVAAAWVKNNLAVSYLWGMPHVGLLQLSMLPNASSIVGGAHMAAALRAGPEWSKFVAENMPKVRLIKGGDISVHEVLAGKLLPGMKEGGFQHIVAANHYVAEKTAVAGYMQYCEKHGIEIDLSKPHPDALRYAQMVVSKAGATPWLIDMPMGLSRGNITGRKGLDALLLQFKSDQLAKGGLIYEAVAGKEGKGDRASRMAWLGASVLYESGVKYAWSAMVSAAMFGLGIISLKDYEKRKEKNKYWTSAALNALDGVPAMGQAAKMIAYGSSGIPVLDAGMNVAKAIKYGKVVAALGALASLGGLPMAGFGTRMLVAGMKGGKKGPEERRAARLKARARARKRR